MLREEELGLAPERVAQVVVEVGELVGVGRDVLQVADVQPLPREVLHQRVGVRVGQHAPHLRLEHRRLAQASRRGQIEQRVVGHAAPEEERQPRRQLDDR